MYKSKNIILFNDDCLNVLKKMPDNHVSTIICDPPYALEFMGKKWDKVLPSIDVWKECLRVAKPGAVLLAFGGARTFHRLGVSLEDAGWIGMDCICWLYGSGFPKSTNISKNIDKEMGIERKVVGKRKRDGGPSGMTADKGWNDDPMKNDDATIDITVPATSKAEQWDGWGTAIKPAWEPILLFMKPREGTYAQNALTHGVAGLNIDGCRISTQEKGNRKHEGKVYTGVADGYKRPNKSSYTNKTDWEMQSGGRWPANLILSHHEECKMVGHKKIKNKSGSVSGKEPSKWTKDVYSDPTERKPFDKHADEEGNEVVESWECHPECPIRLLDEQSGITKSGAMKKEVVAYGGESNTKFLRGRSGPSNQRSDRGGASRFFYCAKASKKERNLGLKDKKNKHPTIKPLGIMKWLVRLTKTPTGGIVLDPFMGSGTTGIACILEGRKFIGIELEKESYEIAEERIKNIEDEER